MRIPELAPLPIEQWETDYSRAQSQESTKKIEPLTTRQRLQNTGRNISQRYAITIARGSDFTAKMTRTMAERGVVGIQDLANKLLGGNEDLTLRFATEAQIHGFAQTVPFLSEEVNERGEPTVRISPDVAKEVSQEIETAKKAEPTAVELTDNLLSARELEIFAKRMPSPPSKMRLLVDNILGKDPHPRDFHPEDIVVLSSQKGIPLESASEENFLRGTNMVTEVDANEAEANKEKEEKTYHSFYD